MPHKPVRDPETGVFYTPRFSYGVVKTVISACRQRVAYRGGMHVQAGPWAGVLAGYGTRVGTGRGIPGVYYPPTSLQGPNEE